MLVTHKTALGVKTPADQQAMLLYLLNGSCQGSPPTQDEDEYKHTISCTLQALKYRGAWALWKCFDLNQAKLTS